MIIQNKQNSSSDALEKYEDYFHYTGPISGEENSSNGSSRNSSIRTSSKTTPILKKRETCDKGSMIEHKIEFLPCEKTKSLDNGIEKYGLINENNKMFGNFVISKNGSFQLPRSPMPKNVLADDYDSEEEESEYDSEEEERNIEDEEEDDDDISDYIETTEYDGKNMLRTASTKSLVKVNPLLFNTECPHKQPVETNFQLGCKQSFDTVEIKHTNLPRTPFPKNQKIMAAENVKAEQDNTITLCSKRVHLDLTSSSMLTRRRTSIPQAPIISILKPTK
ncbi:hypothetical protein QEN19_000551 [Hanseniaspora menglaensis]